MRIFSAIKMLLSVIAVTGILACEEAAPPQDPNAGKRNVAPATVQTCYNKTRNECTSGCYWQERTNSCGSSPEAELTCEQRDATTCQQNTSGSSTQCTYLSASQACITANDNRCDLRRAQADCQAVQGSQCAWINTCVTFSSCEQIPVANCQAASQCRRVQGQGVDVCVDQMKAAQMEQQLRQQQGQGSNAGATILAAALPGAITLLGRLVGLQSGYAPAYSPGYAPAYNPGNVQLGVPVIDGNGSDLDAGVNLDDYTMLPLLASVQQVQAGVPMLGAPGVSSTCQITSPQQCDNQYPTCVWVQNSCQSAQNMTPYQICRGVATGTTGEAGTGELMSTDASQRCKRYSQHCTQTPYSCTELRR